MKDVIEKLKADVAELEQMWASLEEVRDAKVEETPAEPAAPEVPADAPADAPAEPAAPVTEA